MGSRSHNRRPNSLHRYACSPFAARGAWSSRRDESSASSARSAILPYLSQEDYADTLASLIELFDAVKTEADDRISDKALIEVLRAAFDGVCCGSLERLADEVLSQVVRRANGHNNIEWKMTEDA